MTTVGDVLSYVETLAPRAMKMDWDNVGLLCGGRNRPVTKILVALDPFEGVCEEAARWGAELIVTHHPLIFSPLKAVTDDTAIGRAVQLLCANGISAILLQQMSQKIRSPRLTISISGNVSPTRESRG